MRSHEFEPGKLLAGLVVLGTGVVYALDAFGELAVPSLLLVPLLSGGLCLAWVVGAYGPGARRSARRSDDPGGR